MKKPLLKPGLSYPYGPGSMALIFILLLATGPIQASAASMTAEKSTVCEGSWVNASFVLPYEEDQPKGMPDDGGYGKAVFYDLSTDQQVGGTAYTNNGEGKEVMMSFRAPHKLGLYEFRLFRDPFFQILLATAPVEVIACKPVGAYVDTPETVCVGQSANITAWLSPDEDDRFDGSGFVALFRVGTDEEIGGTRSGVNDNCMGACEPKPVKFPLTFQISPGNYEWRMFGDYYGAYLLGTYSVQVIDCDASIPKCDRLVLDLKEGPNSVVIAKVVDACEHKPLSNVILDIRIFHTYDNLLKKAINGDYADLESMKTDENGEALIQVNGNAGDIYRVDVYASKEGWDTSDRSIHITIGEGEETGASGAGRSFSGVWNTDWGTLTLVQDGEHVTGEYTHDSGRVDGVVIGNVLKGTWSEAPTYKPPNDAGDLEFQLGAQGTSFAGRWRYGSSGEWNGWNGELMEEK